MYVTRAVVILLVGILTMSVGWGQSSLRLFKSKNGMMGYRNHLGEVAISPQFSKARPFTEGLAAVQKNGQWGFINKQGNYIIKPLYQDASSFRGGFAKVWYDKLWGMVNAQGKVTIPVKYTKLNHIFGRGNVPTHMARAKQNGAFGVLDKNTGKRLSPFQYQYIATRLIEERLTVQDKAGKYGFLNKNGQQVVACQYDQVKSFSKGKALVEQNGKRFFISPSGEFLRVYDARKDAPVYLIVQQPPTPKGGKAQMEAYIEKNLQYPAQAKANNIKGKVILRFVVEQDGQLSNIKVVKGLGNGCNEEAIRLLKASSPWNAGKQRGKAVRVRQTFLVRFK